MTQSLLTSIQNLSINEHNLVQYDSNINVCKPNIRWVGGKTRVMQHIISNFPNEIFNYHEPFLGGASVLLTFLTYLKANKIKLNGNIYAYDKNLALISMFKNIQTDYKNLYDQCILIQNDFSKSENKKLFFNQMKNEYNSLNDEGLQSFKGSALFIFINKTCFRGMYRTGPNGFNSAYDSRSDFKKLKIVNESNLKSISDLIQNVNFKCCDFVDILPKLKTNDFVYMDPPYFPESKSSFLNYNRDGFNLEQHNSLLKFFQNKKCKCLMSNSNTDFIKTNFQKFDIIYIDCERNLNGKKGNVKTVELIIKNF